MELDPDLPAKLRAHARLSPPPITSDIMALLANKEQTEIASMLLAAAAELEAWREAVDHTQVPLVAGSSIAYCCPTYCPRCRFEAAMKKKGTP